MLSVVSGQTLAIFLICLTRDEGPLFRIVLFAFCHWHALFKTVSAEIWQTVASDLDKQIYATKLQSRNIAWSELTHTPTGLHA